MNLELFLKSVHVFCPKQKLKPVPMGTAQEPSADVLKARSKGAGAGLLVVFCSFFLFSYISDLGGRSKSGSLRFVAQQDGIDVAGLTYFGRAGM